MTCLIDGNTEEIETNNRLEVGDQARIVRASGEKTWAIVIAVNDGVPVLRLHIGGAPKIMNQFRQQKRRRRCG